MPLRDIVYIIIFASVQIPALTRPWVALLVWAWVDYMQLHRFCHDFVMWAVPVTVISSVTTFLSMVVSSERMRYPLTRETVLYLLFMGWMGVTTIFALNPVDASEQFSGVVKIQILIVCTLIVMREAWRVQMLVWTIVVSLGFYGIKGGLFTILSGGSHRVHGPRWSFIADNNDIALAMITTLPLIRYLMLNTQNRLVRSGLGISILLTGVSVLGTHSRGGLLGLVVVILCMLLKSRKKVLFGIVLIAGSFFALSSDLMPKSWFDRMHSIQDYEQDQSAMGRINSWRFAVNLAADRPVLGGGFKTFNRAMFKRYAPNPDDYHEAHSIFFKILAEHGYVGLLMFLLLAFFTYRSASWVMKATRDQPELLWAHDLMSMTQVAIIGYGAGGALLNLAYYDLPYHLMAIVVLTKLRVREQLYASASQGKPAARELSQRELLPA